FKLRPKHRTRSTDEDTLTSITPQHPIIRAILDYRKVKKLDSTYVANMPEFINGDGRVHPTYKIHGTTTGRLACNDPNLLDIPRVPAIRGQFVPASNRIFLEVDANQAELRVLADLSQDPTLIAIYTTKGRSLHKEVLIDLFHSMEYYTAPDSP